MKEEIIIKYFKEIVYIRSFLVRIVLVIIFLEVIKFLIGYK